MREFLIKFLTSRQHDLLFLNLVMIPYIKLVKFEFHKTENFENEPISELNPTEPKTIIKVKGEVKKGWDGNKAGGNREQNTRIRR